MQEYTVIWRDNGDDYMITTIEVPKEQAINMTGKDFVLASAEIEYEGFEDKADFIENVEENGYELLGVILGKVTWVY